MQIQHFKYKICSRNMWNENNEKKSIPPFLNKVKGFLFFLFLFFNISTLHAYGIGQLRCCTSYNLQLQKLSNTQSLKYEEAK